MNSTVIVAGMGFAATILAAWLTARSQRQVDRDGRILDAKVRAYGECSESLYEYARATYNRAKARVDSHHDHDREVLRQEAYRANARARSAIGQALILTGDSDLDWRLSSARHEIGLLNDETNADGLKHRQEAVYQIVKRALEQARSDLMEQRAGKSQRI